MYYSQNLKDNDGHISDTGNWNVADDYSKDKIMQPLRLADVYKRIAKFGFSSLIEELQLNNVVEKDELKIKGFEYLIDILITIIDNSVFAIKFKCDVDELKKHREHLKKIELLIPELYTSTFNQREKTKKITIIDEKYNKALELVTTIQYEINFPLNKSHLIFTDREVFNPIDYKKKLSERIRNKG